MAGQQKDAHAARMDVKCRILDRDGKPVLNEDGNEMMRTIGSAWPHRSGKGMNIELHALPIDGRLAVFEARDDDRKRGGRR